MILPIPTLDGHPTHTEWSHEVAEVSNTRTEANRKIIRQAFDAWYEGTGAITDGRGIANDGQPYENSYAWFMRLHEGKIIDGTAFHDSISFNDLWTRVHP